jgi:hypothetical protein
MGPKWSQEEYAKAPAPFAIGAGRSAMRAGIHLRALHGADNDILCVSRAVTPLRGSTKPVVVIG